jgi:uncharacterized membrane protein
MQGNDFRIFDQGLRKDHMYGAVSFYSPWLLLFLCVSLLGVVSLLLPDEIGQGFSRVTMFFVFLGSLLITAPFYFVFTRFLAEKQKTLTPAGVSGIFVSLMVVVFALAVVCSAVMLVFSSSLLVFNLSVIILFFILSCNWLLLLFLNSVPRFHLITAGYFIGMICTLLLGLAGKAVGGILGFVNFINLGAASLFFILWFMVAEKVKISYTPGTDVYSFMKREPFYPILGVVIALGFLADKIIFWSSGFGKIYRNVFFSFAPYETTVAIAFLTAIPPIIYFILSPEKKIFQKSRKLYQSLSQGAEYGTIRADKKDLVEYMAKAFFNILKIQLAVVFSLNYLATQMFSLFKLPLENVILFRTALWGVACFVIVSFIITFLLYWDFRKYAMFLAVLFLGSNILFNVLVLQLHPKYLTYGFSFACLVTLAAALGIIAYILKNLVYLLFRTPPITQKVRVIRGIKNGTYLIKDGKRI